MISPSDILAARILVVDDLEANVLLLEQMLRGAGYLCVTSTMDPRVVCELHGKNRYDHPARSPDAWHGTRSWKPRRMAAFYAAGD